MRKIIDNIDFVKKLVGYVDVSRHITPNSLPQNNECFDVLCTSKHHITAKQIYQCIVIVNKI